MKVARAAWDAACQCQSIGTEELIEAINDWHSTEDCKAEGRYDCPLCKAIEKAQGWKLNL